MIGEKVFALFQFPSVFDMFLELMLISQENILFCYYFFEFMPFEGLFVLFLRGLGQYPHLLASIYCVYKAIQNRNLAGPIQRSWFLVQSKRSTASRDENVFRLTGALHVCKITRWVSYHHLAIFCLKIVPCKYDMYGNS